MTKQRHGLPSVQSVICNVPRHCHIRADGPVAPRVMAPLARSLLPELRARYKKRRIANRIRSGLPFREERTRISHLAWSTEGTRAVATAALQTEA
jgi:hypothetical protein